MAGYILLFLFVLSAFLLKRRKHQLILVFVGLTTFSALRYGIGYDYYSYLDICRPGAFRGNDFELIPYWIVQFSRRTSPYNFFVVTSVFISFFYYIGIRYGGKLYFEEALFYLCFPFLFYDQLSIIRQGMAASIVFFALALGREDTRQMKTLCIQFLLVCAAILCHRSAYVGFLILIPWQKVPVKILWLMFIGSFVLGNIVTNYVGIIFQWGVVDDISAHKAISYLGIIKENEGKMIRFLIYFITLLSLLLYGRLVKNGKSNAYYIGVLVLGCTLYALFVFNSSLSKRLCMFFFSSSIFLVPQLIRAMKINRYVFVVTCIALFSLQIYVGSHNKRTQDRFNTSASYPYRTFLEKL